MRRILATLATLAMFLPFSVGTTLAASTTGVANGQITMGSPSQKTIFHVQDNGASYADVGDVEYWNFDYPGGIHYYTTNVQCAEINALTKEMRYMYKIPAGNPGAGLFCCVYVKDGGSPGSTHDLYGHNATSVRSTAMEWCKTGTGFSPTLYPITGGNLVVTPD